MSRKIESVGFYGVVCDARTFLMGEFNELETSDQKVWFCENLKTLLCEMELVARYDKQLGGKE